MPLEEDPMKQTAFPFGVGVQTPRRPSDNTVIGALHEASASGVAKPARDEEEPVHEAYASGVAKPAQAAEGIPRTLPDVLSLMKGDASPADARQLLEDIPVLQ